jgi:hypothetical protein
MRDWSGQWLIDDCGTFLPRHGSSVRRFDVPHAGVGSGLADLINNLGFVAMQVRGARVALRLRLKNVSSKALASVFYWLADHRPNGIIVSFEAELRPAEVYPNAETAITRLAKITGTHAFQSRFREQSIAIEKLPKSEHLRHLFEIWRTTQRDAPQSLRSYAAEHVDGRFGMSEMTGGDLIFADIGDNRHIPDPAWRQRAIGTALARQPDADYWGWVACQHRLADLSQQPSVSMVDTEIYWPRTGWVRRHYVRLLLPCVTTKGQRLVFTANAGPTECPAAGPDFTQSQSALPG